MSNHTDLLRRLHTAESGFATVAERDGDFILSNSDCVKHAELCMESRTAIESLVAENDRIEEKLKRLGDEMNEDRRLVANALKVVNDVNESLTAERDALREQIELRKTAHNELADAYDAMSAKNKALELSYDSNLAENDVLVELTATLRAENEALKRDAIAADGMSTERT